MAKRKPTDRDVLVKTLRDLELSYAHKCDGEVYILSWDRFFESIRRIKRQLEVK